MEVYFIYQINMKKLILTQFFVLLAGTIFAWFNFIVELINWLNNRACSTVAQ